MDVGRIVCNVFFIFVILLVYFNIFDYCLVAFAVDSTYSQSSDDLWTLVDQLRGTRGLYNYFHDVGYVADDLSYDNFDYICVLTQQLCTMTKNVKPDLALSVIAVESGFNAGAKNGSARGLMQLIPLYHSSRMSNFVEDGHQIDLDDFFDPRLNIATGLDYLDYILSETDGDIPYALMWYNQGPTSASVDYLDNLYISSYAKNVMLLAENIRSYL